MKQYVKEQLNAVLDVGFACREDTAGFKRIKHDIYVERLRDWIRSFGANWADQPVISVLQGLNDRGVDLRAEFKCHCSYSLPKRYYQSVQDIKKKAYYQ